MKITTFLLLISFASFASTGYSQSEKVTIKLKDASMKELFKNVELQTSYKFLYRDDAVESILVSLDETNTPLDQVLHQALDGSKFGYKILANNLIVIAPNDLLQQTKVTGTVTDSNTGEPLTGVNVSIKGTTTGVVTGLDGKFTITTTDPNAILIFSFIGYLSENVAVEGKSVINVKLNLMVNSLEEVVVVGYGSMTKSSITGSISVVRNDNIAKMVTPQLGQLLQGRVPGMQVSNSDQAPGADLQVSIRGYNSLSAGNSPLVVVDGVIGVSLKSVNPNDIKSIQVLKDASSAAIYGSRGANGVILIETKQGVEGKTIVSLSTYYGIQTVIKKLDLLTAEEQYNLINTYQKSISPDPNYQFINSIDNIANPIITGKGTDWQNVIFQSAPISETNLNIKSGSGKTRFSLSLNYLTQDGVIKYSSYEKTSARLNIDHKVNKWLTVGNNFSYYKSKQNAIRENAGYGTGGDPVTMAAVEFSPILPVYAEDGSFNGALMKGATVDNPLLILQGIDNVVKQDYFTNNVFAEIAITGGLKFRSNFGYISSNSINPSYASKALFATLNQGSANISNSLYSHTIFENTISYNKLINNVHRIDAVIGLTAETEHTFSNSISASGFATETLEFNNIGLAASVKSYSSNDIYSTLASTLGRINYGYKDKYFVTLTGRVDGSSKFAKNNKWAFFPSGSFAWRLSEERFIKDIYAISNAKLRVSYGSIGSQAISPYRSLSAYSVGTYYQRGSSDFSNGTLPSRIDNANLHWEKTNQFDVGFDLGLFEDRFNFTIDYYDKTTTGLLYSKTVSSFTGYTTQLQNIGSMRNSGFEVGTNSYILNGRFKWSLEGNIAFYQNKVLSLGGDTLVYRSSPSGSLSSMGYAQAGILKPGESISSFYGFVFDGIFQNQQEVESLIQNGGNVGGVKFKDLNGDGVINDSDKKILGSGIPKFTIGIGSSFSYKGFDLNFMVQGVFGNSIANISKYYLEQPGSYNYNSTRNALDYWTPENHSNTMQALGTPLGFGYMSSRVIENGSFIRFKNLSIGYTLPKNILNMLKVSDLRIYVSAQNLFTITGYSGYDPEINSGRGSNNSDAEIDQGFDMGGYPGIKQINFGINVSF